jgi:O-acetyl-ADP-ribose deacetylase (regulator of RNase III)
VANKIKVFICYKKILASGVPNKEADTLSYILNSDQQGFESWVDDARLSAGMAWETEIYRQLLLSDVLLVLIGKGTAESQWVRREIALATALGIAIVPLGFDMTLDEMIKETKDLEIYHLQGKVTKNIAMTRAQLLLAELRPDLIAASARTKENQKETLRGLLSRGTAVSSKAPDNQKLATFKVPAGEITIQLHVASGDFLRLRGIDVLVNSENDYMQMARFFESRTVSSTLRRRGSYTRDNRYVDVLQGELDWQLRDRGRPVQLADVFATSAGGPNSELAKINKAKFVFHVAAVQAVDAAATVIPFKEPHQIEKCVRSTLAKLRETNERDGIVSPEGSEQRAEQERRALAGDGKARSILFPLFGTGQGGARASEVIDSIVAGIVGYFADEDDGILADALSEIYISAFRQQDVDDTLEYLRKALHVV